MRKLPDTRLAFNSAIIASFESEVDKSVEEVLSGLGESNKITIYRYLQSNYGIEKKQIPYKIEQFACAIEEIFGFASRVIQIEILKKLHREHQDFSSVSHEPDLHFVSYLKSFQSYLENLQKSSLDHH